MWTRKPVLQHLEPSRGVETLETRRAVRGPTYRRRAQSTEEAPAARTRSHGLVPRVVGAGRARGQWSRPCYGSHRPERSEVQDPGLHAAHAAGHSVHLCADLRPTGTARDTSEAAPTQRPLRII